MLLSRAEFLAMNNPIRAAAQRWIEVPRLRRMGGTLAGARVLEVGCGRGLGVALLLDHLGAGAVDAFDLDPAMVALARRRLAPRGSRVQLWVGDATRIPANDGAYEAVVDFGIIHHVPDWRAALREIHRVLEPGGRLLAEEVYRPFIAAPVIREVFAHPPRDRFDEAQFNQGLRDAGFTVRASRSLFRLFGWHIAEKPR